MPKAAEKKQKAVKQEQSGVVVSNKMAKTIVVQVERAFQHPRYTKVVRRTKKYYAHDEKDQAQIGDRVRIEASRPLSKLKRWNLVKVIEKGAVKVKG